MSFNSKKMFTYIKNDSFYDGGFWDVVEEAGQRIKLGLQPMVYNGLTGIDCDRREWCAYSADPLRDTLQTMVDRTILW